MLSMLISCVNPIRKVIINYQNPNEKKYIVEKHLLKNWQRGVYDINRNGQVDVGVDYFFFSESRFSKKADLWYLHEIEKWEDNDKEIIFKISRYPIRIMQDIDWDGYSDRSYRAKDGIEHEGYKMLYNEAMDYGKDK